MHKIYSIRNAVLEDRDRLTDLCLRSKQSNGYDEAFMAQCVEELRVRDSWITKEDFWLAESGEGDMIGCLRFSSDGQGTGELETCFVDPDWKGKGVAAALFKRLHARALELRVARVGVDSDPFAEGFYSKMGFETVGRVPSGSIPGRTLPRMELILEAGRPTSPGDARGQGPE